GWVTGLDTVAHVAVVAVERRAGQACARRAVAGLDPGAGVAVVAVRVGRTAAGDGRVHAAGDRVAAIGRADHAVVAGVRAVDRGRVELEAEPRSERGD